MPNPSANIERLREYRRVRDAHVSVAESIKRVMDAHAPNAGGAERWLRVWRSTAPSELASAVRSASFSRGTLTLRTENAAWSHRVQAWLRAGGNRTLQTGAPVAIRTVRVVCVRR